MLTTATTLSAWTGIHRDTLRRRLGPLLTGAHGEQVDSVKALPLIYGDGERLDPAQERARLDKVRRGLASLEFKQKQRELVTVEDARKVIDVAATSCREHMMGIPSRWADVLASESDARAVEELLDREIRAGLQRVADARDRF